MLRDISCGERQALADLYDRYADQMMAVGRKYIDQKSTVEAVIHEVFLEVWERAHDYEPDRGTVYTWLMIRMRSRALDKVRYEERRDHPTLEEAATDQEADRGDPYAALEHSWIRRAVDDLPERLRAVLVCTYFCDMTGREIADQLDVPVGTVRSRLRTARRKLEYRVRGDTAVRDE